VANICFDIIDTPNYKLMRKIKTESLTSVNKINPLTAANLILVNKAIDIVFFQAK